MMDQRPSVIIYGNCQAEFLGLLLNSAPSLSSRFDFAVASNNVDPDAAFAGVADKLDRALLLWEQYDQRATVDLRDRIRSAVPAGCPAVRYPAVGLDAFWPFLLKDKRNHPEPGFPFGRYPLGDRVAAEVAELGLPPERAYELYMEMSTERMPEVSRLLERDRAMLVRREEACDVSMSDFVFANLRTTYQFWTRGHLAVVVLAELLFRLLARSGSAIGEIDARTSAELHAAFARYPGQGEFQHPIHPLVIEQLGLQFADETTKYQWFGQSWTFREHMMRYIAYDRSW